MLTGTRRKQLATFTATMYLLTGIAIINSYMTSRTFLQMALKLNSGLNLLILIVFGILNLAITWNIVTWMLFGELRLIEQEHIFERVPFSVLGIIIMTSMFSEYHLMTLLTLSGCLIALKIYHWILKDRLEQRLQAINSETKFRNLIFTQYVRNMIIFGTVTFLIVRHFWTKYLFRDDLTDDDVQLINIGYGLGEFQARIKGSYDSYMSVFLLFGMEFCVLFIDHLNLVCHTILNYYEFYLNDRRQRQLHHRHHNNNNNRRMSSGSLSETDESDFEIDESDSEEEEEDIQDDGLEGKFIYEKIIDIIGGIAKTVIHVLILCRLQLVVIKDIIWDLMSLYKEITSLWKIYKNNRQLDDKLPNIEIADLVDHDNICIVCMDDLVTIPSGKTLKIDEDSAEKQVLLTQVDIDNVKKFKRPKKLPCGHMLHLSCLKNWMERSQTCPICRLAVFDENGKVKPSMVPLRPRSNNNNNNPSNGNGTQQNPFNGLSTAPHPLDMDDQEYETWYTFDISNVQRDDNGEEEIITFTADTLPSSFEKLGNKQSLILQMKHKVKHSDNPQVIQDTDVIREPSVQ